METETEWIGVKEVAAEMGLTHRAAWELIKRLGVDLVDKDHATSTNARFLSSDFKAARTRSMGPAPRRAPRKSASSTQSETVENKRSSAETTAAKMARLRSL